MKPTLGVLVVRVQVDKLHPGHTHLFETVMRENDAVFVLVGDREKVPGKKHPLPGFIRKIMVEETFPGVAVEILYDTPSNRRWSRQLDAKIAEQYPEHTVTLYCSRDGFKDFYSGQYPVTEVPEVSSPSGTGVRTEILREYQEALAGDNKVQQAITTDYRRGMIAAAMARFPINFSTVDIAVMNVQRTHLWLGQKAEDCGRWRFPGGFVDSGDNTRKDAAIREATEELGNIKLDNVIHLGDCLVEDMRYKDEADSVRTDFFVATHTWGAAIASDDLDAIGWFPVVELMDRLIDNHRVLGEMLITYLKNQKENT